MIKWLSQCCEREPMGEVDEWRGTPLGRCSGCQVSAVFEEGTMGTTEKCPACEGEGRVANTEDKEPWSAWETMPATAKAAIHLGLVRPVDCIPCGGTGRKRRET